MMFSRPIRSFFPSLPVLALGFTSLGGPGLSGAVAQETSPPTQPPAIDASKIEAAEGSSVPRNDRASYEKAFSELLNDSALVGNFTIDGKSAGDSKPERYEIRSVSKLDGDDLWGMTTRIKYGDHDVTVPIAVSVKFAGSTPMITLDELFIPGLGTFSARVLFHGNRYAGTWQHGDKGGHMFGYVERISKADDHSSETKLK